MSGPGLPITAVRLTDIERRFMELLCQGVGPKEIGTRVTPKVQRKSVHYYLARVKWKLGARTTYQACAIYATIHPDVVKRGTHCTVAGTEYRSGRPDVTFHEGPQDE